MTNEDDYLRQGADPAQGGVIGGTPGGVPGGATGAGFGAAPNAGFGAAPTAGPGEVPGGAPGGIPGAPAGALPGAAFSQAGMRPDAGWAPQPASSYPASPAPQVAYGTASQPAPKSHGWIVAIVIVVAIALFAVFSVGACTSAINSLGGSSSASALDGLTHDAVGIIDISGTIQYDYTAASPEGLKELLDRAERNDHIKAVVLRVNSGGGVATAGEEMAAYVKQFSKPVVVSSASINASAAYEISSQADYIYVAQSSEMGAIGTAMELTDLSGLLDKLGISMETITSADSKDSSYGYRALTDDERAYYQEMIDQINEVFIQNVAAGRGMDVGDVRALATGMPFTGIAAVENGLADEVGTREDAVEKAAELAGMEGEADTVYIDFDYTYDLSDLYDLLGSARLDLDSLLAALNADAGSASIR